MAKKYDETEIYQAVYRLLLLIYERTHRVTRYHRYTLCQEAKLSLQELLVSIYMVYQFKETTMSEITKMRIQMARFKVFFHLLKDVGVFSKEDIVYIGLSVADISEQIDKWEAYHRKRLAQKSETVPNTPAS